MRWRDEEPKAKGKLRWKDEVEEPNGKLRWKDELSTEIPGKGDASVKKMFGSALETEEKKPAPKKQAAAEKSIFLANVLPIKKDDNIAVKMGKAAVNSAVSALSAPGELHRQVSLQGGSLLAGKGLRETPQNTTFTGDILYPVLPKKTVSGIESWQQEHPVLGGVSAMTVEALTDPATYIVPGGARQALLKREGLGVVTQRGTPKRGFKTTDITPEPAAGTEVMESAQRLEAPRLSESPFTDVLEELQPRVNERITAPLESEKELVNYIHDHFNGEISKNEIRRMDYEEMVDLAQNIASERKGDLWGTMKTEGEKLGLDVDQLYRLETDPEYRAEWERLRAVSGLDEGASVPSGQAGTIKPEPATPQGTPGPKIRSLGESTIKTEWASPELRQGLEQEMVPGGRGMYNPITNPDTLEQARQLIEKDADAVTRRILSGEPTSATDNTAGMLLVQRAQEAGDYAKAVDLTEALAAKATEQGQAIQALSMWGRLTPEGMLRYGQKVIDKANAQNKRMAGRGNRFKMTDETAERIVTLMREAEGLEGRAKEIKVAQALDAIAAQVPAPILRKIGTLHTMAQLLNPKTAIRNLVGNTGFQVWENVSDVIGTGLDVATSAFTGQRSKVLPSLVTQGKGMKKGFKLGLEDAMLGIDTSAQATKFDLPQGRTFRGTKLDYAQDGLLKTTGKAANNFLAGAEKAMNIELRATDRAFYQAAHDESLRQQMAAAAKVGKRPPAPTEAMKEIAHHDGLYRTFQDDNALSAFFQGFKRLLNDPAYTMGFAKDRPMREFGAGDFIIKYPRTPANLLARGLEYSPAGLLKTLWEASRPLMGKEFNQKAFVESFSRAITGTTSGVGLGAALHRLGIITGGPDEDWDVAALERQAGFGEYRLNVSGLKRFVKTFDPEQAKIRLGDTTISYDWFEPQAIPLAVGADIDANKGQAKGIAGTLINAFTTGINAFAEQPVTQGIQTLFGQKEPADAIPAVLKGIPSSFVPSLLNQIKQLVDDQRRITYDPSITQETLNRAIYRTPGLAGSLPKGYGTLGQEQSIYQDGSKLTDNNVFNVFFNPAFINKYAPTPEAQMVLDIYKNTGETDQVPHVIKKYFNIPGGEKITLTAEEYSQMQRQVGELTQQGFARIPADISDEEKIKRMVSVITDTGREARITVLEQRGIPVPESWLPKPGGAKYLLKAIEDGDSQAIETGTMAYCAKNGKSVYDLYKYAHDAGYLDESGQPNPTLQRGLELVWANQGKKQASSSAYSFLLDACAEGNEEEALRWAGVIKSMGKGWKNVEGSIRARAVIDKRNTKNPTLEEIYQGGYKIDPLTVQRALWAMNQ